MAVVRATLPNNYIHPDTAHSCPALVHSQITQLPIEICACTTRLGLLSLSDTFFTAGRMFFQPYHTPILPVDILVCIAAGCNLYILIIRTPPIIEFKQQNYWNNPLLELLICRLLLRGKI